MLDKIKLKCKQWSQLALWFASLALWPLVKPGQIWAQGTDEVFGTIEAPQGVEKYNQQADIGIILFLSKIIRLATIVAGIWTLFNFILAGWIYLTKAGDSSAGQEVSQKILNSVIGLVIVAMAYSIAGLIGLLIFGDASYILQPTLTPIGE